MTNHLACGSSVTIDIDEDTPLLTIKHKLEKATGVPIEFQKVMMGGIAEMYMGDLRTNIKYASCGSTQGPAGLAVKFAKEGVEPPTPNPTPNRADNNGSWTEDWTIKTN